MYKYLLLLVSLIMITSAFSLTDKTQEVSLSLKEEQENEQPDIIFILADDLGYQDLGSYGQIEIKTPNLDQMASEGMRFTQFYSGSTVCRPARCTLMTGFHSGHCYIRQNPTILDLRPQDVTVAEILKTAGYSTGMIGKWALGEEGTAGVPTRQGFDYFYGYLNQTHAHNYYPHFLIRNEERIPLANVVPNPGKDGEGVATEKVEYSHDLITQEALDFIERNQENPFFLYLAYTIPHANAQAGDLGMEVPDYGIYESKDWPDPQKGYAAMVSRLDNDVGRIMGQVEAYDLDKDTIIFFSSDNGPHEAGGIDPDFFDSNGPLRGIKQDLYEGGIRIPLIVRWPAKIEAGTVSNHVGYFPDFFPTAAELAGIKFDHNMDGISFLPTLVGEVDQQKIHDYLYWEYYGDQGIQAVRVADWKAMRKPFWGKIELYNLKDDIGEQYNVANENPEVVRNLNTIMRNAHEPYSIWGVILSGRPRIWLLYVAILLVSASWGTLFLYGAVLLGAILTLLLLLFYFIRKQLATSQSD